MYWDREERTLYLAHSCIQLRAPLVLDLAQVRLSLGVTCPRHRRLLKQNLGPLHWIVPFREWNADETAIVSVWREADANAMRRRS